MPDTSTKTFNINARPAINAVDALANSVKAYNAQVSESVRIQKELKATAQATQAIIVQSANSFALLADNTARYRSELEKQSRALNQESEAIKRLTQDSRGLINVIDSQNEATVRKNLTLADLIKLLIFLSNQQKRLTDQSQRDVAVAQQYNNQLSRMRASVSGAADAMERKNVALEEQTAATKAEVTIVERWMSELRPLNNLLLQQAQRTSQDAEAAGRLTLSTRTLTTQFQRETRAINDKNAALLRALQLFLAMSAAQQRVAGGTAPRLGFSSDSRLQNNFQRTAVFTEGVTTNESRATSSAINGTRGWNNEILRLTQSSLKKNKAISDQSKVVFKEVDAQNAATQAGNGLNRMWLSMRIAIGVLISRGLGALITGFQNSISEAKELSKRISEIQTITLETSNGLLRSAKDTATWKGELQALSRTFGIPTLQTTEALYQALSNQVVQAGNATNFMTEEMKLAITTVSTLDQAVSVTSTVINAFNKNTSDAARINAVLFKAVDLGRFRLEELGSQFGRVSVLSRDLGISFEEQAGAIALLTRLGLNADVAQTLLTNVQLHLLKPTKDMAELLAKWGVNSGEAAIRTFGFANVIKKLAEETSKSVDSTTELATLFQDLRAITGAQGLVGNFEKLQETINSVSSATKAYNKAFDLTLDALGRKADVELEKLRQSFLNSLGEPTLRLLVGLANVSGGADKALQGLLKTLVLATSAYVGYRTALALVAASTSVAAVTTGRFTIFLQANTAASTTNRTALISLTAAQAAFTAGLTLVAAGIADLVIDAGTMGQRLESGFTALRSNLLEQFRKDLEKTINRIDEFAISVEKNNAHVFQSYFRVVAHVRSITAELTEDFAKKFKKIREVMVDGLKISTDILDDRFKELTRNIEKTKKAVEDLKERAIKVKAEASEKAFDATLVGKSDSDALKAIIDRKRALDADALAALRKGELDLSDELFKRSERLASDAEKRIEALKNKVIKDATEIRTRISSTGARSVTTDTGDSETTAFITAPGRPRFGRFATRGTGIGPDGTRDLRGIFGTAGRPPRAGVVTRRTEEIVDTEKLAALEKTLLSLKEAEAKIEKEKLEALKLGEKAKAAEVTKLEAAAKTREKDIGTFKKLVAEIDAFDSTTKDALPKFDELLKKTEAAGKSAGLKPEEQFQFLRQANAQRLLLQRDAETKAVLKVAEIQEKAIAEAAKKKEELDKRTTNAAKKSEEELGALAIQNIEIAARLRSEVERGGSGAGGLFTPFGNKKIDDLKRVSDEFEALNNKLLEVRRNGGDTSKVLAQIASKQKELAFAVNEVETDKNIRRRFSGTDRDASGRILFEKQPGKPQQNLSSLVSESSEALKKVQASFKEAKEAADEFAGAQAALHFLKDQIALIPPEIQAIIDVEKKKEAAIISSEDAIQKVYDGTLKALLDQIKALERIKAMKDAEGAAIAAAGPVVPRAHGGMVGTDRTLVAMSDGEMVMNRLATRQWAPLLRSLNAGPPLARAGGGQVMNFSGDIHIHPTSTTTVGQAREIAQKLTRLERQGLYNR